PCSHGKGRRVQVQSKWAFETVRKTTVDPVLLATALRGDGTGHLGRCPNERIKSSTGQQDARNPAKTRFHVAIQRCPESRLPPAGAAAQGRSCKFSMPNNGTTIPTVATVLLGPSFLNSAVPAGSVTCILALQVPLQFSRIGRKLLEKSGATHGPFASLCALRDGVGVCFWTQQFSRIADIGKLTSG